jgi:hypothetical protein
MLLIAFPMHSPGNHCKMMMRGRQASIRIGQGKKQGGNNTVWPGFRTGPEIAAGHQIVQIQNRAEQGFRRLPQMFYP